MEDIRGVRLRKVELKKIVLGVRMHFRHICLCVSITLSVNSPTGQTPQWIFTVDSLKDPDLRKDVPFRGLDDE